MDRTTSVSSSLQQPPWVSVFSAREQLGHPVPILVSAPASHRPGASSQGIRTDWPARWMSSESWVTSLDPKCPEGPSLGDAPSPMVLWKLRTPSLSWEDGLNVLTPLVLTAVSAPRTWSLWQLCLPSKHILSLSLLPVVPAVQTQGSGTVQHFTAQTPFTPR